jgi:hypothetical protein
MFDRIYCNAYYPLHSGDESSEIFTCVFFLIFINFEVYFSRFRDIQHNYVHAMLSLAFGL